MVGPCHVDIDAAAGLHEFLNRIWVARERVDNSFGILGNLPFEIQFEGSYRIGRAIRARIGDVYR